MGEFENKLNSILSSPQDMEKIMNLARSLSSSLGTQSQDPAENDFSENNSAAEIDSAAADISKIDPGIIAMMGKLMGELGSEKQDEKALLLSSIKPYLKSERQASLDKAVEILRLTKIAKIALSQFGGDLHL